MMSSKYTARIAACAALITARCALAQNPPDLVVVGGHHRVTVSADGSTILSSEPLSSSCLAIKTNEKTSAIVISHVLDPYPIETHVFTSLNYGLPVFVKTSAGNFEFEGSDIHVLDQSSPGGTRNEPRKAPQ